MPLSWLLYTVKEWVGVPASVKIGPMLRVSVEKVGWSFTLLEIPSSMHDDSPITSINPHITNIVFNLFIAKSIFYLKYKRFYRRYIVFSNH